MNARRAVAELLQTLETERIHLSLRGGAISYQPRSRLDEMPDLKERVRELKPMIAAFLRNRDDDHGTETSPTAQGAGVGIEMSSDVTPPGVGIEIHTPEADPGGVGIGMPVSEAETGGVGIEMPTKAPPPGAGIETRDDDPGPGVGIEIPDADIERAQDQLDAGRAIEIDSPLIGRFWYARNPTVIERFRKHGKLIYSPDEIEHLEGLDHSGIAAVHRIKAAFGGTIVPDPRPALDDDEADAPFWTEAEFDEITWFETVGIHQVPDEPFDLTSFIHVKDPALWRQRILDDIAAGPTGPRSRCGGLFNAIQYLRACIQGREQR